MTVNVLYVATILLSEVLRCGLTLAFTGLGDPHHCHRPGHHRAGW